MLGWGVCTVIGLFLLCSLSLNQVGITVKVNLFSVPFICFKYFMMFVWGTLSIAKRLASFGFLLTAWRGGLKMRNCSRFLMISRPSAAFNINFQTFLLREPHPQHGTTVPQDLGPTCPEILS